MKRFSFILFIAALIFTYCSPVNLLTELSGKQWIVSSILEKNLDSNESGDGLPLLYFGEDGSFSGSTGCNSFTGSFKLEGNNISLDPGAITKMMCPGTVEIDFLEAVRQTNGIDLEGHNLYLLSGDKTVMTLISGNE